LTEEAQKNRMNNDGHENGGHYWTNAREKVFSLSRMSQEWLFAPHSGGISHAPLPGCMYNKPRGDSDMTRTREMTQIELFDRDKVLLELRMNVTKTANIANA
jgi:hypothetical protein